MMMTQSYYNNGEFSPFHQANHRALPNHHTHYDRNIPYDYYEGRRGSYPDHGGRPITRALGAHQPPGSNDSAQERKRISVACSRCRRRKIKCSGEPKDGPGCQACRAAGADVHQCSFTRVNSEKVHLAGVDFGYPTSRDGSGSGSAYSASYPDASSASTYNQTLYHRPSIPTLQTRSAYSNEYDSQYDASPVDGYAYGNGRQDSFTGSYGSAENYRSWSTSMPMTTAGMSTGAYYEPQYSYAYSNGNMQNPAYSQTHNTRLPSVTADSFSSLNTMSSLRSSLPSQAAQDRRLPAPYTPQYQIQPAYSGAELPVIPPIAAPRPPQLNGVRTRTSVPWSTDSTQSLTRPTSRNNLAALGGIITTTSSHDSQSITESTFGYQFPPPLIIAPQPTSPVSPSTGPGAGLSTSFPSSSGSESFGTMTMRPPNLRCAFGPSVGNLQLATADERPVSSHDASASLYSFSADASNEGVAQQQPSSSGRRQSQQPQHASSLDNLRRQASFDQHQQQQQQSQQQQQQQDQRGAGHRVSVSNLNSQY